MTWCDLVNDVSTQLPDAAAGAALPCFCYVLAGLLINFGAPGMLALPVGVVLVLAFLFFMRTYGAGVE